MSRHGLQTCKHACRQIDSRQMPCFSMHLHEMTNRQGLKHYKHADKRQTGIPALQACGPTDGKTNRGHRLAIMNAGRLKSRSENATKTNTQRLQLFKHADRQNELSADFPKSRN